MDAETKFSYNFFSPSGQTQYAYSPIKLNGKRNVMQKYSTVINPPREGKLVLVLTGSNCSAVKKIILICKIFCKGKQIPGGT